MEDFLEEAKPWGTSLDRLVKARKAKRDKQHEWQQRDEQGIHKLVYWETQIVWFLYKTLGLHFECSGVAWKTNQYWITLGR